MNGFNDEALNKMLELLKEENPNVKQDEYKEIFNLALSYDLAYMKEAEIIIDGEFTDNFYDDDDAFDFIIEHIANALENVDEDFLSGAVETYFDLHDKIMDELGLVSWE